jgi:hypothetical protein
LSAKDPRAEIVAKAVKDPQFREELRKNPAAGVTRDCTDNTLADPYCTNPNNP